MPRVALGKPLEPQQNSSTATPIPQAVEPAIEHLRSPDHDHVSIITDNPDSTNRPDG